MKVYRMGETKSIKDRQRLQTHERMEKNKEWKKTETRYT